MKYLQLFHKSLSRCCYLCMVLVLLYALLFVSVCVNGVPSNFISVKSNYGVRGAASTNVLVLAPSYRSMPTCVEIFDGKHG